MRAESTQGHWSRGHGSASEGPRDSGHHCKQGFQILCLWEATLLVAGVAAWLWLRGRGSLGPLQHHSTVEQVNFSEHLS